MLVKLLKNLVLMDGSTQRLLMEGCLYIKRHKFSDDIDNIQMFWSAIRTQIHNPIDSSLVMGSDTPALVLKLFIFIFFHNKFAFGE